MTALRLGTLAWPVERTSGLAGYAAKLDRLLAEAAGRADLCLMPEYACVELGPALAGTEADEAAELRAMVQAAPAVLDTMRTAARRHGVWLQPGSLPMAEGDRVVNRAPLIAPDGRLAFQEKRLMTRFEAERWGVSPGAPPQVFETPWGRIGISICYDAEFPKHVRAQVEAGAWLVLVPTCTDTLHGFNRVRFACQARAVENQCFLALAPTVGTAPWSAALDENRGEAAVFGPVDRGFPEDGVLAAGGPDRTGWTFCTLDPARIETVRQEGAVLNHRDWPRSPLPAPGVAVYR
ncbi:carbon-nitrogen hydrolase family protein [Paracraurococcus lichenis]|uniref:Carbon-nitrogen hydrolase family protein n=1 Tax=Paracraurococcus lichenis TaxID=3064888 RepID=A0ABT9DS72_9PROT|nr:carbon-nitrogen hydrolase family protein [Paracraurococcus sp. LOR1-02]MDO9706749.1 carbon-nitrogen hydrolase family protein [Paracraurococcus sp. LOR1-02]